MRNEFTNWKRCLFGLILLLALGLTATPLGAYAQGRADLTPSATSETAFGDIEGPGGTEDEVLANGSWTIIEVVNEADCDVEIEFDDKSGVTTAIPAGTARTINAGSNGGYVGSSVELQYMSGETCASGSVYVQGFK